MENPAVELEGFCDISAILHCAVYALVRRGEVIYVGKSEKPWIRLYAHVCARGKLRQRPVRYKSVKMGIKFDQVFIRPCMLSELDSLEVEMIRKYLPRFNVKDKPLVMPFDIMELIRQMPGVVVAQAPPEPRMRRRL